MRINVWLALFPVLFLSACATERIVDRPVPVEIVKEVPIAVPADFLVLHQKSTIPDFISYAEAIQLWAADRETITALNAQLEAIASLGESR